MDNRTQPLPGGVWRIEVAPQTNAYLVARDGVGDGDGLTLVDTGTRRSGPRLVRSVRLLGLDPRRIDTVLLTHWHADHAGSAARFAASSAAPEIHALRADAAVLLQERPPRAAPRPAAAPLFPAPPRVDVVPLTDGVEIAGVRAVATPGHTEGHCSYWLERAGVLLAGDALHTVLRPAASPRAASSVPHARAASLGRLAALEPAVVACGHGPPVTRNAHDRLRRLAERSGARVP